MTHEDSRPDVETVEDVERLLRVGGKRHAPDAARREIAREAVRVAWRGSLRGRARRRWILAGGPALAAAAALAIAVWLRLSPAPVPASVARVADTNAAFHLRHGQSVRTIASGDEIPPGAVVETPAGAVATLALAGGGELRQNGNTSVRWTGARQLALDRGRIYIDTAGASSPILVETPAGLVRDIGTQFEIDARGERVRVRVREGAVRLESPAGHHQASAGHELAAGPGAPVVERSSRNFGDEWDWILQATPFRLEGATLERFVAWIEREGGLQVEYRPPSLRAEVAATELHGTIRGLSMTAAIATVLPAAGLTHRIQDGKVIIQRGQGEAK